MKDKIINLLIERGESLLDDDGVDRSVAASIADDVMAIINSEPKTATVEVSGGVAEVTFESPGVTVEIIDHDDEEAEIAARHKNNPSEDAAR